ncbi:MAG: hypothetical protein OEV85_14230, partial [Candidatus Thorarchaeota archaeon]|nr:hypothetical protein [Candidatus Thorarchaeota archaeon]
MKGPPKTKHKEIQKVFNQAEDDLKAILKGKKVSESEGPFGESRELLTFELAKSNNLDTEKLLVGKMVNELLLEIFRDIKEEANASDFIQSMTLCLYGLLLGNYDQEDFRFLYRQSLRHIKNQTPIEKWLRKALVFIAAVDNENVHDIITEIRHWIQFLGAPLFGVSSFIEAGSELGIGIQS